MPERFLTVQEAAETDRLLETIADLVAERVVARLNAPNTGRLLSTEEAATETGMTEATIRSAANGGELAHVKVGRVFRFLRSDLDAWIKRSRQE